MLRIGRIAFSIALCALIVAPSANGEHGRQGLDPSELYWLGPYFAGLRLTETPEFPSRPFTYGECEFPEGEGGCTSPIQVQNWTTCERNPLRSNGLPYKMYLLRGGGLATGETTSFDIGTGRQTVTVFTSEYEVMGAALREIRPRSHPVPQPLAPPIYPMPVLRELKRVTVAAERLDGAGAIARATDLSPDEVRMRLRMAELLGPDALAGVPPPTMSVATVKRLSFLAFGVQTHDLAHTAERHKIPVAKLRKQIRRVRGLGGAC